MTTSTHLLIIDPQNDFCDLPPSHCPPDPTAANPAARLAPALPVAGAHCDLLRLAALIRAGGAGLDEITVSLDSHQRLDIAHPTFWQADGGAPVAAFTPITAAQVRAGQFQPRDASALPRALAYLNELQRRGRYTLMVWPVHCEIGSWGHNVHTDLRAAYNAWEQERQRNVQFVNKGSNPWTEHYSAVQAEVPDPADADTQMNRALVDQLARADQVLIAGQASSHCVRATTEDLLDQWPAERAAHTLLLTDCMSPVAGFEAQQAGFFAAMRARGVRLATSLEVLPLLRSVQFNRRPPCSS